MGKNQCKNPFWYLWTAMIILLIASNLFQVLSILNEPNELKAYIFIYAFGVILLGVLYWRIYKKSEKKIMAIFIFTGALIIRLLALYFGEYIPSNDFYNYFNLGNNFFNGNYELISQMTQGYRIPKLAGIGVLYGFLAHIFSPTLLGVELINCIFTALICVEIYFLLSLQSNRAAAISAFIYMVYPTSIISSQITTNHHAATVFLLPAFYVFFLALNKDFSHNKKSTIILFFISAVLLVLSDMMHPSAIIAICAFVAFCAISFVSKCLHKEREKKERYSFDILVRCTCVCALYAVILNLNLIIMESVGLCKMDSAETVLSKIRVGLDVEHNGFWWPGGYTEVEAIENLDEQREFCMQEIKRNLNNPSEVLGLMWKKTNIAWFDGDGYYSFYFDGKSMQLSEEFLEAETQGLSQKAEEIYEQQLNIYNKTVMLSNFDILYVYAIWLFAMFGLFALIRTPEITILDLTTWFPLGWMAFISITELQTRYRYQSMPFIIMLSGFGLSSIYGKLRMYFDKIHTRYVLNRKDNFKVD